MQLSITVVGVGQHTAIIIGCGLHSAQMIVGKGYNVTVTVGLAGQKTILLAIGIGCQSTVTDLHGQHIAKAVIGHIVGLGIAFTVLAFDGTQVAFGISIL